MRRRALDLEPNMLLTLRGGGGATVDHVDALLLGNVLKTHSITGAAKATGISYRGAWDRISKMNARIKEQVLVAEHGGKSGGSATLTTKGRELLSEYRRMSSYLTAALEDDEFWQHLGYRISARNRLHARITEVTNGSVASEIKLTVIPPSRLTSIISNEAVSELGLEPGDEVEAVIKATEIIIAKAVGPGQGSAKAGPRPSGRRKSV